MQLPFFYITPEEASQPEIRLNEENARHAVQVLRMKPGERLVLTDGKGVLIRAIILNIQKKNCVVRAESSVTHPRPGRQVTVAISLLKNASRFEWFLEKATELGVLRFVPLICSRTEREKFRFERLNGILISAMLQSQQTWLPQLAAPANLDKVLPQIQAAQKFIGYCDPLVDKEKLGMLGPFSDAVVLIGPEGDFTPSEFELSVSYGYKAISLGETRLRTETAALAASALLLLKD